MIKHIQEMIQKGKEITVVHVIKRQIQVALYCIEDYVELNEELHIPQVIEAIKQRKTTCVQHADTTIFVECIYKKPPLYIFGGGTIAYPLSKLAMMCGFDVHIFDERKEYVNQQRFPWVAHLHHMPFQEVFLKTKFEKQAYYVLATQGHSKDEICLKEILKKSYHYIGVVGSRRKGILLKRHFEELGFSSEQLAHLHIPRGLPILSSTPEEIAVSIIAELIQERAKHLRIECHESIWLDIKTPCVVATILTHQGSTPRGTGSKMIVYKDGHITGSIGGGRIEYQVMTKAKEFYESSHQSMIMDFNLSHIPGEEGMVCGGTACVLLEKFL